MFTQIKQTLARIPSPIAGLALGLASLGACLDSRFLTEGGLRGVGAIMAAGILLLLLAKFITQPKIVAIEMQHPVIGSVLPTFTMALMVIAKWLFLFFPQVALVLWYTAIIVHLSLLVGFIYHRLRERHWHFMVPSWFVPPIGIIVAAVTCPSPEQYALAKALVMFGLFSYLLMLTPMLYRLIFHPTLADDAKPTIAIMAAPASLILAGYLNITREPNLLLVALLFGIAITMTGLVYIAFFHLLRLPFNPGYAAFTFPVVISAAAMYHCADLLAHLNFLQGNVLYWLADIELAIACVVVLYVAVRYIHALLFDERHRIFG